MILAITSNLDCNTRVESLNIIIIFIIFTAHVNKNLSVRLMVPLKVIQ